MKRHIPALALTALALTLAGCASSANQPGVTGGGGATGGATGTSVGATTGATAGASTGATSGDSSNGSTSGTGSTGGGGGGVVRVGDADKGKTVSVHAGQRVALVLTGGYWQVQGSSAPGVLRQDGGPTYLSPSPANCAPGMGCQPQETDFSALTAGTAQITASRTSCGEARACVGDQGHYRVTVQVLS